MLGSHAISFLCGKGMEGSIIELMDTVRHPPDTLSTQQLPLAEESSLAQSTPPPWGQSTTKDSSVKAYKDLSTLSLLRTSLHHQPNLSALWGSMRSLLRLYHSPTSPSVQFCILYTPTAVDAKSAPQETSYMLISISDSASQETTCSTWQIREIKLGSVTHLPSIFFFFPSFLSFIIHSFIYSHMHACNKHWLRNLHETGTELIRKPTDLISFTKRCLHIFFFVFILFGVQGTS